MDRNTAFGSGGKSAPSRRHRFGHRETSRSTWLPVSGAVLSVLGLGVLLQLADSSRLNQAGLVVLGAGIIGAIGTWLSYVVNRQSRRRDTQMQINMGATLDACDLTAADLQGAYLRHRQMNSIRLAHSNCAGADFTASSMNDAVLTRADLRHAWFDGIGGFDLHGYRADFRWARFKNADLRESHFEESDVRQCDFTDADLTAADFRKADLRGTNFVDASLTGVRFGGAVYDEHTKWPTAMSESQRDARGLVLTSQSSRQLLRGPRRLRALVSAAAAGLAVSVGAVAVSATMLAASPTAPKLDVLGASEVRPVISVEGSGIARVIVDDGSGPVIDLVELPAAWPANTGAVSVVAERAIGGGALSCSIEQGEETLALASDGGSTSDYGAVLVTCRAFIGE